MLIKKVRNQQNVEVITIKQISLLRKLQELLNSMSLEHFKTLVNNSKPLKEAIVIKGEYTTVGIKSTVESH